MTLEQFQIERTHIISAMLDNPDEHEIYPTSECFKKLDELYKRIVQEASLAKD
ncbi:MAG: hypothetical protein ACUZ8H_03615 [Candidatus Anammoxibacter sp.]